MCSNRDTMNGVYNKLVGNIPDNAYQSKSEIQVMSIPYSIFHIENDINCKVLKFGKELCVAYANDDSVINLLKGRHKLTFVSLENEQDFHDIVYEVPENGIEDFIEVSLAPIRDARVERERIEYEKEQKRLAFLEQQRIEEEARKIAQLEKQKKEEEERQEAERLLKMEEEQRQNAERVRSIHETHIQNKIFHALELCKSMDDIANYEFNGLKWEKALDGLYYLYKNGVLVSECGYKKVSRFSCNFARVVKDRGYNYINEKGELLFSHSYLSASHFYDNKVLVTYHPNGNALLKDNCGNTIEQYSITRESAFDITKGIIVYKNEIEKDKSYELRIINSITREEIYTVGFCDN